MKKTIVVTKEHPNKDTAKFLPIGTILIPFTIQENLNNRDLLSSPVPKCYWINELNSKVIVQIGPTCLDDYSWQVSLIADEFSEEITEKYHVEGEIPMYEEPFNNRLSAICGFLKDILITLTQPEVNQMINTIKRTEERIKLLSEIYATELIPNHYLNVMTTEHGGISLASLILNPDTVKRLIVVELSVLMRNLSKLKKELKTKNI